MSAIPAPNIAELGGQIAQAPLNAFAEYQRTQALKQQAALTQQETQAAALQNQQTQAINQAYQGAFKTDTNGNKVLDTDALQTELANSGHGAAIPSVLEGITKYKTALGGLQEQQQKIQGAAKDALGNLGYAIQQANYDPRLVHTLIEDELNDPALGPQQKQQILQLRGTILQNPDAIKPLVDQWVAQSPAQQERAIQRTTAQAKAGEARAAQFKEVNGALYDVSGEQPKLVTPQGGQSLADWNSLVDNVAPVASNRELNLRTKSAVGFYLGQGNFKAAQDAITKAGEQVGSVEKEIAVQTNPQIQAGKVQVARNTALVRQEVQNAGAAADQNGNPSEIAQAIANGQMAWKDAVSMRTPMATKNAILKQVFQLNPNFDTAEFGLEADAAKKARSGAWADTRVAYNTAIDHSKQLLDTIDALNNRDVKKLNSLKNFFKSEFGSPDVPDFAAVANAYNHEVTSVVSKNHITDAEVQAGGAVLPSNASPQALRKVVASYNQLMASKRNELDKVVKAGAGNKANAVLNVTSSGESGANTDPFAAFGGKAR